MWLTWSQMVALFIPTSLCIGFSSPKSAGTEFITAFMENIAAYYRSSNPVHKLFISALKSGTRVNITVEDKNWKLNLTMSAGHTERVELPPGLELNKFNTSYKTVRVNSNFPVTVFSISLKGISIDTSIVQPVQNLGREYRLASPAGPSDGLYRFVIINTQLVNTVTVSHPSQEPLTVTLGPYENVQLQSPKHASTLVTARTPVAVLFGHPCIQKTYCRCGLAFEQLTPVSSWGTAFIVPYLSVARRRNQSLLLVTSDGTDPESILPSEYVVPPNMTIPALLNGSLYIQTSMPVSVSLSEIGAMALIPEESFSTCYLLHTIDWSPNFFLIVVKTAEKDGVRLGHGPLPSAVRWAEVAKSDYSVGLFSHDQPNMHRVIWHLTSKMAVYIIGRHRGIIFGSPALSMKVEPDGSKCTADIGDLVLVLEEKSWADAQVHCWNLNSQLASFNRLSTLEHAVQELGEAYQGTVWIGLRRSLLSGEWRWLNREPMEYSKWGSGEPNSSVTTQCAMTSLKSVKRLTWSAVSCCDQLPFICFKPGNEIPFP